MSQESISFFEDKTVEQIINWMIAHLSESQLRACLNSAGITPDYSAGPSSSTTGQRPSVTGQRPSVPEPVLLPTLCRFNRFNRFNRYHNLHLQQRRNQDNFLHLMYLHIWTRV